MINIYDVLCRMYKDGDLSGDINISSNIDESKTIEEQYDQIIWPIVSGFTQPTKQKVLDKYVDMIRDEKWESVKSVRAGMINDQIDTSQIYSIIYDPSKTEEDLKAIDEDFIITELNK